MQFFNGQNTYYVCLDCQSIQGQYVNLGQFENGHNIQLRMTQVDNPPLEQQDQTMEIGRYQSKTAEETIQQILTSKVTPTRNLMRLEVIKKRKDFNQPYKFTQADSDKNHHFLSFKDDNLGLTKNMVMEIGLQGSGPYTSTGAQTFFKRKINKCLQIDQIAEEEQPRLEVKDDDLMLFLENVYPEMEAALQSNETLDIFQDDFNVLPKSQGGSKESAEISNNIKQTKNLFYLACKGKKVSCIQFQPWVGSYKNIPIIAQSFVENLEFDQRVIFSMKSSKSVILFWNYEDMHAIDPLLILSSPLEIMTFEFNPKDPSIIIAGAINGQIMMWDLKGLQIGIASKKKVKKTQTGSMKEITPVITSVLQDPASVQAVSDIVKRNVASHKAPIVCIRWFPSGLELDMKKNISTFISPPSSSQLNQFASISTDGQVLLWEKKFLDAQKKPVTDLSQYSWKAGYGFHLFRPEGGGQMGGSSMVFKKNEKRSVFTGTSDQGQLFVCDWSARSADEAGSKNQTITAYWNQERSFRPIVALDLLPCNEDIVLTVYDYHFCVWKTNVQVPIFTSMVTKGCYHTCGCWSPTRAGVLFIAKSNGTIDIWDFMDQSHKWNMQYSVGSVGISSMRFHEHNPNILAVGSQEGSLHILQLPFTLARKIGDEDKTMNQFWKREIESVKYFSTRFEQRYEQSQQERARLDNQERLRQQRQQKKEKLDDEERQINGEYQQYAKKYLDQVIYGIVPEQQKQDPKKGGKK